MVIPPLKSSLKRLKQKRFIITQKRLSPKEMKLVISEYIGHHNYIRPHSTNGYLSSVQFENKRKEHLSQMEEYLSLKKC